MSKKMAHISVMLSEICSFLPERANGFLLDVTAGGGGHFFELLKRRPMWKGEAWDQDPEAAQRVDLRAKFLQISNSWSFVQKKFGEIPSHTHFYDFILADIGISSFQLDDPMRGMSLFSQQQVDFRMNPSQGPSFWEWIQGKTEVDLEQIFEVYGEEPKAKKLAHYLKNLSADSSLTATALAESFKKLLNYGSPSRIHPATRAFQALRIAINDELGELKKLLQWAPHRLSPGGRLAIISFHSLEDRFVKKAFQDLAETQAFDILTKKPLVPSSKELEENPRSRSAKLRVLERKG